jgi:hypothetical protein
MNAAGATRDVVDFVIDMERRRHTRRSMPRSSLGRSCRTREDAAPIHHTLSILRHVSASR